jgi:aminopeptidase N
VRALAVSAARPAAAGKDAAWNAVIEDHRVPIGSVGMVGRAFWRRSQDAMLALYTKRYLEALPTLHNHGMIPAMSIAGAMFPRSIGDEGFIERATAAANQRDVSPAVRRSVIESCDRLQRRLRARGL